jgi:hypothetical protein
MQNITVEEIMDVIDSTSIEMYNSEWSELKLAITKLIESKKVSDMKCKYEIVGLYEWDDEYQVIDSDRTVWFQGSKVDCKKYIKKNK